MPEEATAEESRVAELLRVNEELAAEIRSLSLDRRSAPRPAQLPAARGLARLVGERDKLAEQLEAETAGLASTKAELDSIKVEWDRLVRENSVLAAEVTRLRGGRSGLLRRALARLFRL
jgi:hypothetical protein